MNKWWKCALYKAVFWFRKRTTHKVFGLGHQIYNYNKKLKVMFWTNLLKQLKNYFRFFIYQHPATHRSPFPDLARCSCTKRKPFLVKSFMWTLQRMEKSQFNPFLLLHLIQGFQSTPSGLWKKKPKTLKPQNYQKKHKKTPVTTKPNHWRNLAIERNLGHSKEI